MTAAPRCALRFFPVLAFLYALISALAVVSLHATPDKQAVAGEHGERVDALFSPPTAASGNVVEKREAAGEPLPQNRSGRRRLIGLNARVADRKGFQAGEKIRLNLFDDREYTARVDQVSVNVNGTVTLRARVDGSRWGYCLISTTNGKSLGSISIPEAGEAYHILPSSGGDHHLTAVDGTEELPPSCGAQVPPVASQQNVRQPAEMGREPLGQPTEPVTVDVMIVYTPAAREWADVSGGGIFNVIAQSMAKANLALDNSGTFLSWNLVNSTEVDYTESGRAQADLIRLTTSPSFQPYGKTWEGYSLSGYLDEVHEWRDAYGADLVAMFAAVQDAGGLGWVLNSPSGAPDWGFTLTRVQQAASTLTHPHEMGHNLGLHHHAEQNFQPGPGLFSYSAGWRWIGSNGNPYCSVMTYGSGSYFDDNRTHQMVAHFSNPEIDYSGVSTGHFIEADNARTLRETKHQVAGYRTRIDVPIGEAVGQPGWTWVSGGDASWRVQGAGAGSEGYAGQSGPIDDEEESWLETTVEGPGNIHFWWRVSSEPSYDFLHFFVDGQEMDRIAGESGWEERTYAVPVGVHTLRWSYDKDRSVSQGADAGWLDEVVWEPTAPAEPATYSAWLAQTNLPENEQGIKDDPGGAGIPNWHRYAFGMDPDQPELSHLPKPRVLRLLVEGVQKEYLTISFPRSDTISDIIYRPEASGDLRHWEPLKNPEHLVETEIDGNWHYVTFRDQVPLKQADSRFLRVGILSVLGQAVGQPKRDWGTGGNRPWVVQDEVSLQGETAVESGAISHDDQSWLETSVAGPGAIRFWWKVSSEAGWDFLEFLIDGEKRAQIAGDIDWEERTFLIPAGSHHLRWRYAKDGSTSDGDDAGWVDRVEWTPDSPSATVSVE